MDWMVENKVWEWMFSGIGVVFVSWVAGKVGKKRKGKRDQRGIDGEVKETNNQGVSVGTQINITNSPVGAVGDHIHVSGGIHLNAGNTVESVRCGESGHGSQTANRLNPSGKSRVCESKNAPNISEPQPFKNFTDFVLPGGAMDVASHFYIERREDGKVLDGISRNRGLVTLQGPRQTGKTSMMLRLYADAREKGMPFRPVMVDFQSLERHHLETLAGIWQAILTEMDTQLNLGQFNDALWNPNANVDRNVTAFLDRAVFSGNDTPLMICLDEVDRVFSMPIRSDFFPVLRAFYNRGAIDPAWRKVRWLLSTSSEPRFFIDDLTQSPFNVGVRVALDAFSFEETLAFVRRYGFIDQPGLTEKIMNYVGGRPYLVHLLLHHLTLEPARENDFFDAGTAGSGIFRSHINRYLSKLQEQPDLALSMKSVLAGNGCKDVKLAGRLSAAGLVKEDADGGLVCACQLYATYLKGKL